MARSSSEPSIRAVVVEDEPLGRDRLRRLLQDHAEIEIVKECSNGQDAVAVITKLKPDLVFMDIQLPELDGFEVLGSIASDDMPAIIFITAHDEYAIRAFELHALDYLLKSFDRDRFGQAVRRAIAEIFERKHKFRERLMALLEDVGSRRKQGRLMIRSAGRIIFLRVEEIDWISSADNYASIHVGRETHVLRSTMKALEDRLDPSSFVRIHRAAIVNLDRIRELKPLFHGDYAVLLHDGTELTLARTRYEELRKLLEKFS